MTVRHTTETWIKRAKKVHNNNPNLSYICSHIEGEKWRLVFCMKPGHGLFRASKQNHTKIMNPSGCLTCAIEKRRCFFSLGHEEYCRRVDRLNSSLKPVEYYVNTRTPIRHKCMICLKVRYYRPGDILGGHYHCYYDSKANSKGNDFIACKEKSIEMFGDVIDFSKFLKNKFDFEQSGTMICKICSCEWERNMHQHLRPLHSKNKNGLACPKCSHMQSGKARRKTWDECKSDFEKLKKNGYHNELELREETRNAYEKTDSVVPVYCAICKEFYHTNMSKLLSSKHGCSKHRFKTERFVVKYIESELAKISDKYTVVHHNLKHYEGVGAVDISVNYDGKTITFVEVDGRQHFSDDAYFSVVGRSVEETQKSDVNKHIKAEHLNIHVIRVYQEYALNNNDAINKLVNSIEKIRLQQPIIIEDLFIDDGKNVYQEHTLYHYESQKLEVFNKSKTPS